jgi:hypothetical protein
MGFPLFAAWTHLLIVGGDTGADVVTKMMASALSMAAGLARIC